MFDRKISESELSYQVNQMIEWSMDRKLAGVNKIIESLLRTVSDMKSVSQTDLDARLGEITKRIETLPSQDAINTINARLDGIVIPAIPPLPDNSLIEGKIGGLESEISSMKSTLNSMSSDIRRFKEELNAEYESSIEIMDKAFFELLEVQDEVVRKKLAGSKADDYKRALAEHNRIRNAEKVRQELGWTQL